MTEVDRGSFTDSFSYDENGNMDCRTESGVTYVQTYSAENRISSIVKLATGTCSTPGAYTAKWDFTYDGDGVRTGQSYTPYTDGQPGTVVITRYFFGGAYETTGNTWKKYYSFGGATLMRDADGFKYFLSDHLGSVSVVLSATGTVLEQQRYLPFGGVRTDLPSPNYRITNTDFTYTGQRNLPDTGLMDYKARFYSPSLGRFIQPDTIVPGAANPQSFNRYSYVSNNPIEYTDPSGHRACRSDYLCKRRAEKQYERWNAFVKAREDFLKNIVTNVLKALLEEQYGVTLSGNWTYENTQAAYNAVTMVGNRFAETRGVGETSGDAFKAVYGNINFTWGGKDAQGQCADPKIDSGGCTTSAHQINFWSLSGHGGNDQDRMTKNIVHELGHAFNASLGYRVPGGLWKSPSENMPSNVFYDGVRDDVLRPNVPDDRLDWQQHPPSMDAEGSSRSETFADIFVAWTYDGWNTNSENPAAITDVRNYMNGLVSLPYDSSR